MQIGQYRHYKGNDYDVIGVARHSETHEELVVYRTLYGHFDLWVRPKAMFEDMVTINGKTVPRFAFIGRSNDQRGGEHMGYHIHNPDRGRDD